MKRTALFLGGLLLLPISSFGQQPESVGLQMCNSKKQESSKVTESSRIHHELSWIFEKVENKEILPFSTNPDVFNASRLAVSGFQIIEIEHYRDDCQKNIYIRLSDDVGEKIQYLYQWTD